jgi:hypothetical protein
METRTSPLNLKRSFHLLGYDGFQYTDTNGFSGGIIVAWKERMIEIDVFLSIFSFFI